MKNSTAVDAVIFTIKGTELFVYLNFREKAPFKGLLEIPGGLLSSQETAEDTLKRKLINVLGIKAVFFQQFYTFTKPNRDPRGRVVSIGFIALASSDKLSDITHLYPLNSLPRLAFDHKEIIEKARLYLKQNIESQLVKEFMPKIFPLNDLQKVYEVIGGKKLDNRNFRKKILNSGTVTKVNKKQEYVNHRPATLYRFE